METEAYAAMKASNDIVYFRAFLEELGFPPPQSIPLYVDNMSLIPLVQQFSGKNN